SDSRKLSKKMFCNEEILIETNNKNLMFLECDITNSILLEQIIIKIKPDYIFHFGAQPYIIPSWEDPVNTIEVNVIGTLNVFEPIKKHGIKTRVIVACSATEFGTTASIDRPLKESDPLLALHPYGISKIAAELLSRQYYLNFGIESINLRFFNLTGTRRTNDAPSDFIRNIAQIELELKEPLIEVGNLEPYRDFLDVNDAVNAIWLAATKGSPGETYHVCSGKKIQIKELLNNSLSLSSKKIKVKENVDAKLRSSDEDMIIGDHSKITDELSWKPIKTLQDTLKDMFHYWLKIYEKS
ncbi:MAG: GDP-mannose 4,6-dehydratase, partial [Candidatus Lokiarchaeota archaeon]|nr:GDP-mannose 4,6-dehydratase [Candidatus Lokiarchaeota archaeon]